jgi:hypothetical protein
MASPRLQVVLEVEEPSTLGSATHAEGRANLIRTTSQANPLWSTPRIHGELLKAGIDVCEATVAKYMVHQRRPPSQTWPYVPGESPPTIMAAGFFVVPPRRAACSAS